MSVVIPVRDDVQMLFRCLAALENQSRRADEVIVVDNGSIDDGAALAARFGAIVVVEAEHGISAAASAGYDAASGEIIVRCDADTMPPPGWLKTIESILEDRPDAVAITGPGRFYDLAALPRLIAGLIYMRGYFVLMRVALGNNVVFGSNFAMRRAQWAAVRHRVHRHDQQVHDDIDLGYHFDPTATVLVDSRIGVGISGRPFSDIGSMVIRTRRASHTARIHGIGQLPLSRWAKRMAGGRSGWPAGGPEHRGLRGEPRPDGDPTRAPGPSPTGRYRSHEPDHSSHHEGSPCASSSSSSSD